MPLFHSDHFFPNYQEAKPEEYLLPTRPYCIEMIATSFVGFGTDTEKFILYRLRKLFVMLCHPEYTCSIAYSRNKTSCVDFKIRNSNLF
jgi:hypothetical protein